MYGPWIKTKHLYDGATIAKVAPSELTDEEKLMIQRAFFGYCEAHQNLYRKITHERLRETGGGSALLECPVKALSCHCDDPACPSLFKRHQLGECKEWGPWQS